MGVARRPRVGVVVVSHSRALAEAAVALASQMVGDGGPPVAVAAGTAEGGLGTDATAVAAALVEVVARLAAGPGSGVLVLMDLGSAVLSAELAVELAGELAVPVRLSAAPIVEGLVAAVVQAAGGADIDEVAAEAAAGLAGKQAQLGDVPPRGHAALALSGGGPQSLTGRLTLVNPHGLHARPAAALVVLIRGFRAQVQVSDVTSGTGPADGRSMTAVSALGAEFGHELQVVVTGEQAREALDAVLALAGSGFGEGTVEVEGRSGGAVRQVVGDGTPPTAPTPAAGAGVGHTLTGFPASGGLGIGPAWLLEPDTPPIPGSPRGEPGAESAALDDALSAVGAVLRETSRRTTASAGPAAGGIFDAHALLLDDPELLDPARAAIDAGAPAALAWRDASELVAARIDGLADPYQRARATDVRSVARQVLRALAGGRPDGSAPPRGRPGVLVAADVAPEDVTRLDAALVTGIVTAHGSSTSHAAILAHSLGIPMVVGVGPGVLRIEPGVTLAVDGDAGLVQVAPAAAVVAETNRRISEGTAARSRARARAQEPAVTLDGTHIEVEANVRSAADAAVARSEGADGVGLLRTEFLFLDRPAAPTEAEQVAAYGAVAAAMDGRRVTIRTLDVGGDKPLSYVPQPVEANPFLGLRGLRLALARPALLESQLRAVVRVAARHPVAVMFPMVTSVAEVRAARYALEAAAAAVSPASPPPALEFGIMVEVPAAALRATHLAPLVDFFSIGTNDLTQYTLAAERGNAAVASLADGLDPTVLRLIADVCRAAAPHGTRVAVCGELAADPVAAAVLVGLGVRELSVASGSVAAVKASVRAVSVPDAEILASQLLDLGSASEVRMRVASAPSRVE